MRRLAIVRILCILLAAVAVGRAQDKPPRALPKALPEALPKTVPDALVQARKGTWDEATVVEAIDALVATECIPVAGWWLAAADRAIDERKLPRSTGSKLKNAQKALTALLSEKHADAVKVGADLAKRAAALAKGKNYVVARRAIVAARMHTCFFPDPAALKTLAKAERRIMKLRVKKGSTKKSARSARRVDALVEKSHEQLRALDERLIDAWAEFGTADSYAPCAAFATLRGGDGVAKRLAAMRKVALSFGAGLELELLAVGNDDAVVYVGGERVAAQPGGNTLQYAPENAKWKVITTRALPGEPIVLQLTDPHALSAVFIHARVNGKAVPVDHVVGMESSDPAQAFLGQGVGIRTGKEEAQPSGNPMASITSRCANFGAVMVPVYDKMATWFEAHGAKMKCVLATKPCPCYVVDVPAGR